MMIVYLKHLATTVTKNFSSCWLYMYSCSPPVVSAFIESVAMHSSVAETVCRPSGCAPALLGLMLQTYTISLHYNVMPVVVLIIIIAGMPLTGA